MSNPDLCCWYAAFGARTLDYDADSDSSSSDDELSRRYPAAGGSSPLAAALEDDKGGAGQDDFGDEQEEYEEDDDEAGEDAQEEEDEPPLPSSSADGPIVDIPSGISWWGPLIIPKPCPKHVQLELHCPARLFKASYVTFLVRRHEKHLPLDAHGKKGVSTGQSLHWQWLSGCWAAPRCLGWSCTPSGQRQ